MNSLSPNHQHTSPLLQRSTIKAFLLLLLVPVFFQGTTDAASVDTGSHPPIEKPETVQDTLAEPGEHLPAPREDSSFRQQNGFAETVASPDAIQGDKPATPPQPQNTNSLARAVMQDSLLNAVLQQRRITRPPTPNEIHACGSISQELLFRSNVSGISAVPSLQRFAISPRQGIALSTNHLLYYGNVVPLVRTYNGTRLIHNRAPSYTGDDNSTLSEIRAITLPDPEHAYYDYYTKPLVTPEVQFMWENGLFDENILAFRFSRALSRRLMLSIYSNYQSFKRMTFSHDAGNIFSFFASLTADTTVLSHQGYNPYVNEFYSGALLTWNGERTRTLFGIKYGDLAHEYPLNQRQQNRNFPNYGYLSHYPLTLTYSMVNTAPSLVFYGAEAVYENSPVRRTLPLTATGGAPAKTQAKVEQLNIAGRVGITTKGYDSIGIDLQAHYLSLQGFDSSKATINRVRPEVFIFHPLSFMQIPTSVELNAGTALHQSDSIIENTFTSRIALKTALNNMRVYTYFLHDNLPTTPYFLHVDSTAPLKNNYNRAGVEIRKQWHLIDMLVGYQWCTMFDSAFVNRYWVESAPPYRQPQSSLIFAPTLGRLHGLQLMSRTLVSTSRPYVKSYNLLSLQLYPSSTSEVIDLSLGCDYWSERDRVTFAEVSGWNRPLLNISFEAAAHIRSFRLFYKIDNLLNRNDAYIPGYQLPGITFRWGLNWFIQR